jgi:hypothetical protein
MIEFPDINVIMWFYYVGYSQNPNAVIVGMIVFVIYSFVFVFCKATEVKYSSLM